MVSANCKALSFLKHSIQSFRKDKRKDELETESSINFFVFWVTKRTILTYDVDFKARQLASLLSLDVQKGEKMPYFKRGVCYNFYIYEARYETLRRFVEKRPHCVGQMIMSYSPCLLGYIISCPCIQEEKLKHLKIAPLPLLISTYHSPIFSLLFIYLFIYIFFVYLKAKSSNHVVCFPYG